MPTRITDIDITQVDFNRSNRWNARKVGVCPQSIANLRSLHGLPPSADRGGKNNRVAKPKVPKLPKGKHDRKPQKERLMARWLQLDFTKSRAELAEELGVCRSRIPQIKREVRQHIQNRGDP